jgi:hypothetical protein
LPLARALVEITIFSWFIARLYHKDRHLFGDLASCAMGSRPAKTIHSKRSAQNDPLEDRPSGSV